MKVILETGELKDPDAIADASDIAIAAGADFIKTSTGKVAVNATPEAADVILQRIKEANVNCGIKIAGGVKTIDDASIYLTQADNVFGPDWITPQTFRFGASGLLLALNAAIEDKDLLSTHSGY